MSDEPRFHHAKIVIHKSAFEGPTEAKVARFLDALRAEERQYADDVKVWFRAERRRWRNYARRRRLAVKRRKRRVARRRGK